jgi:D-galactose 1-dehydrogenase
LRQAELFIPANRDTPITASLGFAAPSASNLEQVTADFDFRQEGEQTWTIDISTHDGGSITLTHGGTRLFVDGEPKTIETDQEYPAIYQRFADLINSSSSDVDLRPLRLVADAFMLGRRIETDPFNW